MYCARSSSIWAEPSSATDRSPWPACRCWQRQPSGWGSTEESRASVAPSSKPRASSTSATCRVPTTCRDLFVDTAARLREALGRDVSEDFDAWFYEAQRAVMIREMVLREDCLETLGALRERGLRLVLVSNIDDDFLEPMLDNLGLRAHLDYWISSEAARSCKPDARIFRQALARAGCEPGEALFVGDSRIHDIQGARAVGIPAVLIAEEGGVSHLDDESFDAEPDHVIRTLPELVGIVDASRQRPMPELRLHSIAISVCTQPT
jgi:HAD superfamily hydrolase (TIGR01509 family)